MKFIQKSVICFLFLIFISQNSWEFAIELLENTLPADKPGKSVNAVISNQDSRLLAVELYMKTRSINIDGQEINKDVSENILVVPSQILLQPGEQQLISVIWQDKLNQDYEASYRLIAEELPIYKDEKPLKLKPDQYAGAKIYFIRRFAKAVYVTPPNATPNLVIESAIPTTNQQNESQLELVFSNIGTRHILLKDIELTLKLKNNPEKQVKFLPPEFSKGFNILAKSKIRKYIKWPKDFPVAPVVAEFKII